MDLHDESQNAIEITTLSADATSATVVPQSNNSQVIKNGTLVGTIISSTSQPSLTIQVNQGDHNSKIITRTTKTTIPPQNSNQSVSIVNCYRAVPAHINESNIDSNEQNDLNLDVINLDRDNNPRTYISTEAQTDDLQNRIEEIKPNRQILISQNEYSLRENRRRERRERRQARRLPFHSHNHIGNVLNQQSITSFEILPDLLNSHLPPPYSTLPGSPGPIVPSIVSAVTVGSPEELRYAFSIPVIRRQVLIFRHKII